MIEKTKGKKPESEAAEAEKLPITSHLRELRNRLLISIVAFFVLFVVGFYFASQIFDLLVIPLSDSWEQIDVGDAEVARGMIYTALHEKFFTDIKLAFFTALFFALPLLVSQIWIFIAPGLYRQEKRAFLPFLIATPILFLLGAAFVYFLVMPAAWNFFLSFEQLPGQIGSDQVAIQLQPKVSEYLNLTIGLILAFAFSFELPVLLTLLVKVELLSVATLRRNRRIAIVVAFVLAAILTPPDPISQILLALPLIFLYECAVIAGRMIEAARPHQDTD